MNHQTQFVCLHRSLLVASMEVKSQQAALIRSESMTYYDYRHK